MWCRYGITHTLDEVFKAPGLVKHILQEESGLHEVYVGTACVLLPFLI